ncbi:AEC family transporter [Coraliomargarita parva]|uniref:AEC family transporter n=1 Tax=Coraliomargarita parva TaxID=3014050 RepID=UPI0022B372F8|nr:AEC family transporter [Coraliomargarita parva]
MPTTQLIFTAVMPIFLVIGAGFLVRKLGWLDAEADRSLMSVVVNLLYPCFIFDHILGNDALRQPSNILLPPLVGLTTIVAGFALAMLVARKFGLGDQRECRTFAFTTGIYNYGYLPIPIIALLFDRETTGVLLVHNLGVEIAMWTLGVGFILSANDPKSAWRRIFSGPVIAILLATPLNLLQIDQRMPDMFIESISLLGQSAIPLGLLLTGATFADLAAGVKMKENKRLPVIGCLLRLGILPALFLLVAFILPLPSELKAVMCIQAAMPCGVFPIVLARHFDGSPEVALKLVLSTTLISLVTIPLWITIGLKLLGLHS